MSVYIQSCTWLTPHIRTRRPGFLGSFKMAEIEWESIAPCLLNLLGNCELGFEEATYPIAANVFNGVELAYPLFVMLRIAPMNGGV